MTSLLLLLLFSPVAWSQILVDEEKKEVIEISMAVNYGSAYRDGSWVPVDVFVKNTKFDITGFVEIRVYSGNDLQSPVYRIPAESPKESNKRFRAHCFLQGSSKIEAMIYNEGNAVLDVFPWQTLLPIPEKDFLALILDQERSDYGFLSEVLEKQQRGVHPESLKNESLGELADYIQCYEPLDLIIMGDVDPTQIDQRHRALLAQYVEAGGVLTVCLGNNARFYKGSWVEDLLGVEIGASEPVEEKILAESIFAGDDREGARDARECLFTHLTARDPSVKMRGSTKKIASLRALGAGYVVGLAVDTASRSLGRCKGYSRLWEDISHLKKGEKNLNFTEAAAACSQNSPYVAGVHLQPKSSVLIYLLLYFGIGIVGNWLVCNAIKRRESFWIFLPIFSIGFTAYALIYGTAGRARSSELEQFELVHLIKGAKQAQVHSMIGILTARSARYSMSIDNEQALVRDSNDWRNYVVTSASPPPSRGQRRFQPVDTHSKPFRYVQTDTGLIEDFTIGASEMRYAHAEMSADLQGGIEGELVWSNEELQGAFENKTGLEIQNPSVVLSGYAYPLQFSGDSFHLSVPTDDLNNDKYRLTPTSQNKQTDTLDLLKKDFFAAVFSVHRDQDEVVYYSKPCLTGWAKLPFVKADDPKRPLRKNITEQLVVVDLDLRDLRDSRDKTPYYTSLQVSFGPNGQLGGYGGVATAPPPLIWNNQSQRTIIQIPEWLRSKPQEPIWVELSWSASPSVDLVFKPLGAPNDWSSTNMKKHENRGENQNARTIKTFAITDWANLPNALKGSLECEVSLTTPTSNSVRQSFHLSAKVQATRPEPAKEDLNAWQ